MMTKNEMLDVYGLMLSIGEMNQPVKFDSSFKPTKVLILILSQVIDHALKSDKSDKNDKSEKSDGMDLLSVLPSEAEELRKLSDYLLQKAGIKDFAERLKLLR